MLIEVIFFPTFLVICALVLRLVINVKRIDKNVKQDYAVVCMSKEHKRSDCWIPECVMTGHKRLLNAESWKRTMTYRFPALEFIYVEVEMN